MNTFLPYPDFQRSAFVLDDEHLENQRRGCLYVLNAIAKHVKGNTPLPSVRMWTRHPHALTLYALAICDECEVRGIPDKKLRSKILQASATLPLEMDLPAWIGDPRVHVSHQSNLIRLNPEHYQKLFPGVPNNLPYYWPV